MGRGRFLYSSLSALQRPEKGKRTMDEKTSGNEPVPSDEDGLIWHFTSLDALPKILLDKDGLLAGHTSFMSDPEDCSLINRNRSVEVGAFSTWIEAQREECLIDPATVDTTREWFKIGREHPIFIVCFTTVTNDYRRWIDSAKNGGFSIGFESAALEDALKSAGIVLRQNCTYHDYEEWSQKILKREQRLTEFDKIVRVVGANLPQAKTDIEEFLTECFKNEEQLVFKKRPNLEWEQEYRVACSFDGDIPKDRLRFIAGKPFVTLALPVHIRQCVRKIKVSPFGDVTKSKIVADFVAKAIGLTGDDIIDVTVSMENANKNNRDAKWKPK